MIKIERNGFELPFKSFNFPAGEVGFKLDLKTNWVAYTAKTNFFAPALYQKIIARLRNSNDVLELIMAVDALRRLDIKPVPTRLYMPYCPYSRQDRVCDFGESFSLKVFANLINSMDLEEVVTLDVHSNVANGVFNRFRSISQLEIVSTLFKLFSDRVLSSNCCFVSPDFGASKKTGDLAAYYNHSGYIKADKRRNLSTGEILETVVYHDDFKGLDVICADDLIDGGKTFTELAKVCKAKNCGKFVLLVTHGIFSKGVDILFKNGIDEIFTTDSYYEGNDERVKVLKL